MTALPRRPGHLAHILLRVPPRNRIEEPPPQEAALATTLILFCLATIQPSACTIETALTRVAGPPTSVEQCLLSSETVLAAHPHAILGDQYAKVLCTTHRS